MYLTINTKYQLLFFIIFYCYLIVETCVSSKTHCLSESVCEICFIDLGKEIDHLFNELPFFYKKKLFKEVKFKTVNNQALLTFTVN